MDSTSKTRNSQRSDRNRMFLGAITMVIEEMRRWAQLFPDPLSWIFEFEGHPQFMRVMRSEFTSRYGSIYQCDATPNMIKDLLADINSTTFRHLLFVAGETRIDEDEPAHKCKSMGSPSEHVEVEKQLDSHFAGNVLPQCSAVAVPELPLATASMDGFGYIDDTCWTVPDVVQMYNQVEIDDVREEIEKKIEISSEGVANLNVVEVLFQTLGDDTRVLKDESLKWMILNQQANCYVDRVYEHLGKRQEEKLYDQFPVVIFTPPGFGLTDLNRDEFQGRARHTDQAFFWTKYSPVVLTTNSANISRALFSIALIPPEHLIVSRSRLLFSIGRGKVLSRYEAKMMINDCRKAKFKIKSSRSIGEALRDSAEGRELLERCRESVNSPLSHALWSGWQLAN